MTILTALKAHYDRLADRGAAPPFGYSTEGIGFALVLNTDGEVVERKDLRNPSEKKKLVAKAVAVPEKPRGNTSGIKPTFLWGNTKYTLGYSLNNDTKARERFDKHLTAYREYHLGLLADTTDDGMLALCRFIERWNPDDFAPPYFDNELLGHNLVFMLKNDVGGSGDPRFLHDRPEARRIWEWVKAKAAGVHKMCLVTGQIAPVATLHSSIHGVWGAQPSGASLVSFNKDSFQSYGKEQGANAPVGDAAVFGYGTALNAMLGRDSRNRIQIADASTVFWADAAVVGESAAEKAEAVVREGLDPPSPSDADKKKPSAKNKRQEKQRLRDEGETAALRDDALTPLQQGRALREIDPDLREDTKFYILGLAPNSGRLSVRFWHDTTLGPLVERIRKHWSDLSIEPPAWKRPPSARALLYETALQRKSENIPPRLGGELMRAILTGGRYPRTLLTAVILRIRADGEISGRRAAICKACITRDVRLRGILSDDDPEVNNYETEDLPVSLDRTQLNPAYRMGRLFAVLEKAQRAALGKVNASIRDRYFGAASATPSSIFPLLLRGANHHLSVLRKKSDTGGLTFWFESEIGEILNGLESMNLPRHLRLEDQGRFVVGYYHQRFDKMAPAAVADVPDSDVPTSDDSDDTSETSDN